jgi:uncharacterized paraquat-inducible protein A
VPPQTNTPPERGDYYRPQTYPRWRDERVDQRWRRLSWWQHQRNSRDALTAAFDNEHLIACARCGLTLPINDTGNCPGCDYTHRRPHDQRHTITALADLIAALLA